MKNKNEEVILIVKNEDWSELRDRHKDKNYEEEGEFVS